MENFISFTLTFIFLLLLIIFKKNIFAFLKKHKYEKIESNIIYIFLIITSIIPILFVTLKGTFPNTLLILYLLYFIMTLFFIKKKITIPEIKYSTIISLLTTVIVTGTFCFFISNKTMPITEGWYSVYAKLINTGSLPYKDFGLLFMPLYSYIIAFITSIFGYKIIVLRIFGGIIFSLISACMFFIYKKLFKSNSISVLVSITSALYLQSEIVQIFYDYIRIFDLFTYIGIIFMLLYIEKRMNDKNRFSLSLVFAGIFLSLSFLIRQNSGAITCFYLLVLIIFLSILFKNKKQGIKDIFIYILSLLLPILCFGLYFNKVGILNDALTKTTGSAIESKGGLISVLFAWIPRVVKSWYSSILVLFLINIVLIVCYMLYKKFKKDKPIKYNIYTIVSVITIFAGIFLCFYITKLRTFSLIRSGNIPNILFFVIVELFIIEFINILVKFKSKDFDKKFHIILFSTLGMIIAINYGSGTSAGLSEGQSALGLGAVLGLILYLTNNKTGIVIKPLINLLCIFICLSIFSTKYYRPYSWWGVEVSRLDTQKYSIDVDELESIYVSKKEKEAFEDISKYIKDNSTKEDSVFEFPHSPLFYLITDRYPETYSIVQWFDVCTDEMLEGDIKKIENNKPKFIIHVHIPEYAVNEHERMFRGYKKSGLRKMNSYLIKTEKKEYKLVKKYKIQGLKISLYELNNEENGLEVDQ